MSIVPEAKYQQGINRKWVREDKEDFYRPEFAHISEQPILKQEVFFTADGATTDETTFAYQSAWDEYRTNRSIVTGKIASDLNYWHLSRLFSGAPSFNEDFITTEQLSQNRRDAWAVTDVENGTYGQFMIQWRNITKAIRLMPFISDPGMLDHI